MAVKAPRRIRVGEKIAPGDVRPATTRTVVTAGLAVVVLVAAATTAILLAGSSTKPRNTSAGNVPQGVPVAPTTYVASYQETVDLPPLLRSAPSRSDPAKHEVVSAELTLQCTSTCKQGSYRGFAGSYPVTAQGSQLTAAVHTACQDDALILKATSRFTAPGQLPLTLTGVLTRTSTCPGTQVASPVTLHLRRG